MHLHKRAFGWVLFVVCVLAAAFVAAQQTVDPDANISFPPPVYLLRGEVPIMGSASVQGMTHYYVEFRRLNDDLSPQDDNAPWFPALYGDTTVADGELGRWNTALIQDGLYELRLSISLENNSPRYVVVSPLRVENEIPPFLVTPSPTVRPTSALPTLFPTPTALGANPRGTLRPTQSGLENQARVTAVIDANMRAGDSTIFPIVGVLFTGEVAQVLGISGTGTGWYLVRAPNGTEGWIAPSTVDTAGDFSTVPFVRPPATPTFTPIPPTATPANLPDLLINGFRFDPLAPACGQSFSIFMNITNIGAGTTLTSGSVVVQDILVSNNQVIATGAGTFNTIAVGANFVVVVPMFVNAAPNQLHRIVVTLDSAAQIPESNESNNTFTQDYTLAQGSCP